MLLSPGGPRRGVSRKLIRGQRERENDNFHSTEAIRWKSAINQWALPAPGVAAERDGKGGWKSQLLLDTLFALPSQPLGLQCHLLEAFPLWHGEPSTLLSLKKRFWIRGAIFENRAFKNLKDWDTVDIFYNSLQVVCFDSIYWGRYATKMLTKSSYIHFLKLKNSLKKNRLVRWLIRTYCIAQRTLLNTLEWPIWEKNLKKSGYMYMYNRFTLLCTWN